MISDFFYSHLYIQDMHLEYLPHICTGKPYIYNVLYTRAGEKRGIPVLHAHIMLTTFTRFAQNRTVGSILALYGSTMHVATLMPYFQAR